MAEPQCYLFVYGTLLPHHTPPSLRETVSRLVTVGPARVRGSLYDLGGYPGAVLGDETHGWIQGRVMRLPSDGAVIRQLDRYEGCDPRDPSGSLFRRTGCSAQLDSGETLACWIYVYNGNHSGASLIPGGDFGRFRSRRSTPKIRGG